MTAITILSTLSIKPASLPPARMTTSAARVPVAGTPATGAVVSINDGVLPFYSHNGRSPPTPSFLSPASPQAPGPYLWIADPIPWKSVPSPSSLYRNHHTQLIDHPCLASGGYNSVILSSTVIMGMISGRVTNTANIPIAGGITVSVGRKVLRQAPTDPIISGWLQDVMI